MGCFADKTGVVVCSPCNKAMSAEVTAYNRRLTVGTSPVNSKMHITAGIVCRSGLNMWEVFNVSEGTLVLEDGVLKVYKSK